MQATGATDYLRTAASFWTDHLNKESFNSDTMGVNWDSYHYMATILLATLTDLPAYHQEARYFMRQWVCSYQQVQQPARGFAALQPLQPAALYETQEGQCWWLQCTCLSLPRLKFSSNRLHMAPFMSATVHAAA